LNTLRRFEPTSGRPEFHDATVRRRRDTLRATMIALNSFVVVR
jgi:hypothetical protein